ncbi:MAG TPA: tripartite tricarboxylate transporter substrate binding protein [Burkholderiales bacterium]|jgi:tripartite-type tricarboxylate transporter receptor subunit TctC|nr:tripartite tricarboxylate transporter substrate binding protein [Burkholderiales bacterium]
MNALRLLFALLLALPLPALAQYPARAVHVVVPFPAGGPTDILTRALGQKLSERWGQPVVVDNKPGAGGAIGSEFVAKAPADGYTLLMATSSTHSIGPALQKLPYDPLRDFAPISQVSNATNVLVVSPKLGVTSVKELIALAKAKPGQLNFASSGVGTIPHLTGELFKLKAGVDIQHVPYKGTGLSIPDLANGQVAMLFDSIVTALNYVKAGNVRALAISSPRRTPLAPDLPTMAESGLPGFESETWFGLFGPAATPKDIVARVSADTASALKAPDLRERFAAAGAEPVGSTPEQFLERVRADAARWAEIIKAANIKVQ